MELRLGFLASHGGTNMRAICSAIREGRLQAQPAVVISNNSGAPALAYARDHGISAHHLSDYTHGERLDEAIRDTLLAHGVNLVILNGYMKKVGPATLAAFHNRILNVHPALLPKFGGKGMYGRHVHEAVLAAGERESGLTIHLVDEEYDHGPVLGQARVPVLPGDTPEALGARVLEREQAYYVELLQGIASGAVRLPD